MADHLIQFVISDYLAEYKNSIDSEPVDERNVMLSFPLHYSGNHRVEVTITQLSADKFVISDMSQTLDELRDAGHAITHNLRKRIQNIANINGLRIVDDYLVLECSKKDLGKSLQRFIEAAKTIGDAYLAFSIKPPQEENLINAVRAVLNKRKVLFRESQAVRGKIENHKINFLVPPNGTPGLALAVLPNPTKQLAEAWGFKVGDIKSANSNLSVGIVYDPERAGNASKDIMNNVADLAIPSDKMAALESGLEEKGLIKH
jgi:hypothetical protein